MQNSGEEGHLVAAMLKSETLGFEFEDIGKSTSENFSQLIIGLEKMPEN